jgi:hypothetical protein
MYTRTPRNSQGRFNKQPSSRVSLTDAAAFSVGALLASYVAPKIVEVVGAYAIAGGLKAARKGKRWACISYEMARTLSRKGA